MNMVIRQQTKRKWNILLGITLLCALMPYLAKAQGTTGNTITFDSNNCTVLYSGDANTSSVGAYFSYLRHNQAPIQILNANPQANSNTIAALQEADGNGMFASSHMANNMVFAGTNPGELEFYNFKDYYDAQCFAIIAPKGYRITEYAMDICSNPHANRKISNSNGAAGATIMRYTYEEGSTYQWSEVSGESMVLTGKDSEVFSNTLTNAKNILYFKVKYQNSSTQWCTHMNSLRLTYVIEESFEEAIPSKNGTNQVSTGILNLGPFKKVSGGNIFIRDNVTDYEDINIVAENGSPEMSVVDGVINVTGDNTYYIESPAKYRITGATLNFQMAQGSTETKWEERGTALASILGKKVKISDGKGNYLVVRSNSSGATNATTVESATTWIITAASGTNTYYIKNENGDYLLRNNSGTLTTGTTATTWTYYENYSISWTYGWSNYSITSDHCFITTSGGNDYGLRCNSGNWAASRQKNGRYTGAAYTPASINYTEEVTLSIAGNTAYTATVYQADGNQVQETASISLDKPEKSVTVSGMNNDALKFKVDGASAGFTVDLKLEPLNPTLQTLEIGYKAEDGTEKNSVPVSASNYNFGDNIVIPILLPDQGKANEIVFRNAYNENGANCFLVDSKYEQNSFANPDDNKVNADMAGTTEVEFSNIKLLNSGQATEYQEYAFEKSQAGYQTITLSSSDAAKTVYIYSGDRPLYCIMTDVGKNVNRHEAYTFYKATLKAEDIKEVPQIELKELLTETYKGENNKVASYNTAMGKSVSVAKDSKSDTTHKFYGVKVTSKMESGTGTAPGYLNIEAIVKAIEDKMKEQVGAVYDDDYLRTILYVDMSALKSVAASSTAGEYSLQHLMLGTADNCLFFMPTGYNAVANNVVEGGEGGRSTGDVVLYDQQPFYSPYNFSTGTRTANYTRNVVPVAGHEDVTTVTLVLPFAVSLSKEGHLKNSSDNVNRDITFYQLTGDVSKNKTNDKIYDIKPDPVASEKAEAGVPYVVMSANGATGGKLFEIAATGVVYPKTNELTLTGQDGPFVSHGTFNGTVIRDESIFYFSKDYFWNSKTLKDNYVNIRPFRGWYTSNDGNINSLAKFGLVIDMDEISATGISRVETEKSGIVYDLQGRKVSTTGISALPRGLYIMDGKKVIKQ